MPNATGHIVVRRRAKDGSPGADGARGPKIRWRLLKLTESYQSGADGEEYCDVMFHAVYQQFFTCIQSISTLTPDKFPTQSASNAYWEWNPGLESLFVDMLCANEAFLDSLTVRHLYTADGKTQILEGGYLKAVNAVIEGSLETTLTYISNSITLSDKLNIATVGDSIYQVITLPSSPSFIGKRTTICNTNFPPYTKTSIGWCTTIQIDSAARSRYIGIGGNIDIEATSSDYPQTIDSIVIRGGVVELLGVPAYGNYSDQYCRWMLISGHRCIMRYTTL